MTKRRYAHIYAKRRAQAAAMNHPNSRPGNRHGAHSYPHEPINLSRDHRSIIQLIWNSTSTCCVCDDRKDPARRHHKNRMVYRHDGEAENLYCIPCAAQCFGMDQDSLVQSLNLEQTFNDQACAARVERRERRALEFQTA